MQEQPTFTLEERTTDFTMALREVLMSYFKGTCVENLARSYVHGISMNEKRLNYDPSQGRAYNWQREEHRQSMPSTIMFRDSPLMDVQHYPDKTTFFMPVFGRSEELRNVYAQLRTFYETYLPGVELEENNDERYKRYASSEIDKSITVATRTIPELFPEPKEEEEDEIDEPVRPVWDVSPRPLREWVSYATSTTITSTESPDAPEQVESTGTWRPMRLANVTYEYNEESGEIRNIAYRGTRGNEQTQGRSTSDS